MQTRVATLIALLVLAACGAQPERNVRKDCDCGFYTDASGKKMLLWPDGDKVVFHFNKDVPQDLRPALSAGAQSYNLILATTRIELDVHQEDAPAIVGGKPSSVSGDGVNGVYWVPEPWPWKDKDPSAAAMTVVLFENGHIKEADVFFRASSYDGPVYAPNGAVKSTPMGSKVKETEFRNAAAGLRTEGASHITDGATANVKWSYMLAIHEFGHALGRIHSKNEESIMYPKVGIDDIAHPFSEYDLEILGKGYTLAQ